MYSSPLLFSIRPLALLALCRPASGEAALESVPYMMPYMMSWVSGDDRPLWLRLRLLPRCKGQSRNKQRMGSKGRSQIISLHRAAHDHPAIPARTEWKDTCSSCARWDRGHRSMKAVRCMGSDSCRCLPARNRRAGEEVANAACISLAIATAATESQSGAGGTGPRARKTSSSAARGSSTPRSGDGRVSPSRNR